MSESRRFIYEWLDLGRFDNLRPNPEKFGNWDGQLAADMQL